MAMNGSGKGGATTTTAAAAAATADDDESEARLLEMVRESLRVENGRGNGVSVSVSAGSATKATKAKAAAATTPVSGSKTDVFARLHASAEKSAARLEAKRAEAAVVDPITGRRLFHPQLTPTSSSGKEETVHERSQVTISRRDRTVAQIKQSEQAERSKSRMAPKSNQILRDAMRRRFVEGMGATENVRSGLAAIDVDVDAGGGRVVDALVRLSSQRDAGVTETLLDVAFAPLTDIKDDDDARVIREALAARRAKPRQSPRGVPSSGASAAVAASASRSTPGTFSPQTTPRSKALDEARTRKLGLDPSLPRDELLYKEAQLSVERREALRMQHAKKDLAGCTFQPNVRSTSGAKAQAHSRLFEDYQARARQAREALENAAKKREERELAECTFSPRVVVVSGSKPRTERRVEGFDAAVARLREGNARRREREREEEMARERDFPRTLRRDVVSSGGAAATKGATVVQRPRSPQRESALLRQQEHADAVAARVRWDELFVDDDQGEGEVDGEGDLEPTAAVIRVDLGAERGGLVEVTCAVGEDPFEVAVAFGDEFGLGEDEMEAVAEALVRAAHVGSYTTNHE